MERKNNYDEVTDEIESALKDSRGISSHQKRLAFCLSLGVSDLLETYLKKKKILKQGYKIDHRLLKKNKENAKKLLAEKITSPIESLDKLDKILDVAYKIENKRNDLAYGSAASEDLLRELVNLFLDLKKDIEND